MRGVCAGALDEAGKRLSDNECVIGFDTGGEEYDHGVAAGQ